ncbi:MAG: prepilin-type N-terminal cleavage/methylation domain-containing protein [Vulcanimicrobiota bacterium]
MRKRGFTLLEVTCTVALIAMSGALLMVSVRGSQGRASASALAEALADELRSARQLAIGRGCPVAAIFPSNGGSKSHSDSMVLLAGASFPQQIKVVHFGGDFPGTSIFNGSWTPASGASVVTNLALPGSKWAAFKLESWLPATKHQDYCLVFMPDGTVRTNNLAAFNGAYHVLVTSGVGAVAPGPGPSSANPNFTLNYQYPQVCGEARTISVDACGSISISPGVLDSNLNPHGAMANLTAPASPPPSVPLPNASANIVKVEVTSKGNGSGPDVTVAPDGYVSLRTVAEDPLMSGQTLYCNWTVKKTSGIGSGDGAYSIPVAKNRGTAMQWDPNGVSAGVGAWVSNWQWRPPADAGTDDTYLLSLLIQDAAGATVKVGPPSTVTVVPVGKVLYETDATGPFSLFTMNTDGYAKRRFHVFPHKGSNPSPASEGWPSASLDGNRIAFQSNRAGGTIMQLFLTDRSGSSVVQLTDAVSAPQGIECPSISPWGDRIAYKKFVGGTPQLWVMDADGGNNRMVDLGPISASNEVGQPGKNMLWDRIAWNPDDNKTVFYTKGHKIYQYDIDSALPPPTTHVYPTTSDLARAPYLLRWGSVATPDVFYSVDDGDPFIFHNAHVAAGSPGVREEQPCPWNDAGTLRAFVVRSANGTTGQIVRYTLTGSATAPSDDKVLTPGPADYRCPVFLP